MGLMGIRANGGAATDASLNFPSAVAVDNSGNLFIADTGNSVIRKVDKNGIITTVAGNGRTCLFRRRRPSHSASLYYPYGLTVDDSGNLLIVDTGNNRIRKVDASGIITTVVGNGINGYSGDGGAATNASLDYPQGISVDAFGNLLVADTDNHRLREVNPNGTIQDGGGKMAIPDIPATAARPPMPACITRKVWPWTLMAIRSLSIGVTHAFGKCCFQVIPTLKQRTLVLAIRAIIPSSSLVFHGSITSSIVTLTVVSPIVSQPHSLLVANGSQPSFSVSVSSTLPLSFQWQKDGTNLTGGGNISGSTTTTWS